MPNKQKTHRYKNEYTETSTENEEGRITAATEAAAETAAHNAASIITENFFGKPRRTSRKKVRKNRRTSKVRSRSFGSGYESTLKNFLIVVLLILTRSLVKGQPYSSIDNDLDTIGNVLTISSILELIEKLVGRENKDRILLIYAVYFVGNELMN